MTNTLAHLRRHPKLEPGTDYAVNTSSGLKVGRTVGATFEEIVEEAARRGYAWTDRAIRIFEASRTSSEPIEVLAVLDHDARAVDFIPAPVPVKREPE